MPDPETRTTSEAQGPRERLLARAVEYYAEHGVRDTSLRTLAAAIGTSQRMLSYHFGSREQLLVAVMDASVRADNAALDQLDPTDPLAGGQDFWTVIADHAESFGALFFELSAHVMYGTPHAAPFRDTLVRDTEARVAEAFGPLADAETAEILARLTVAVGRGLTFEMLVDGDRAKSDRAVELYLALLRGLLDRER